jgi:hypothetical protein
MTIAKRWLVSFALLPLAACATPEGGEDVGEGASALCHSECGDGSCQPLCESSKSCPLDCGPTPEPQCGPSQQAFWTIINLGGTATAPVITGYAPPGVWADATNTVEHSFYYRRVGTLTWKRINFADSRCNTPQVFSDSDTFLLFGCPFSFSAQPGYKYELQHRVTCADGSVTLGNTDDRCMTETPSEWASGPTHTPTSCVVGAPDAPVVCGDGVCNKQELFTCPLDCGTPCKTEPCPLE